MQAQIINLESSEKSRRVDDKSIRIANRKERMNGIAFMVRKVQFIMFMDDEQLADTLIVDKEEIENVHYLKDSEISVDLLFRLHYAAVLFSKETYLDKKERKKMHELKKACYEEISRRNNWI